MNSRYVLFPGYVISQTDAQRHYIDAQNLARCWGVPYSKCAIAMDSAAFPHERRIGDIELRPRADGKYNHVPEPVKA